jgi:hypothetical protein
VPAPDPSIEQLRRTWQALQDMRHGPSALIEAVAAVCADGSLRDTFGLMPLPDIDTPPAYAGWVLEPPSVQHISATRAWLRPGPGPAPDTAAPCRQVLLLRIQAGGQIGYIMELQKRMARAGDGWRFVERFSGLAFRMTDESRRAECVAFVAYRTAARRLIMADSYLSPLLARPRCFKHRSDEHGGAAGALRIALSKIGLLPAQAAVPPGPVYPYDPRRRPPARYGR